MYGYQALSLAIRSQIELEDLDPAPSDAAVDLHIRRGVVQRAAVPSASAEPAPRYGARAFLLSEPSFAILVRDGREIVVDAPGGAPADAVRLQLQGPALGVALAQLGRPVLHGSAVASTEGSATIFAGAAGSGKSTLALALARRGHGLLTDDMSLVQLTGGTFQLSKGPPRVKLWPDSAEVLGLPEWPVWPRVRPSLEKRVVRLQDVFCQPDAASIQSVCALRDGPRYRLERLKGSEALAELVAQTYAMRAWPRASLARHLMICAALIEQVPIYRLYRPRDLSRLGELVAFVETQLLER